MPDSTVTTYKNLLNKQFLSTNGLNGNALKKFGSEILKKTVSNIDALTEKEAETVYNALVKAGGDE